MTIDIRQPILFKKTAVNVYAPCTEVPRSPLLTLDHGHESAGPIPLLTFPTFYPTSPNAIRNSGLVVVVYRIRGESRAAPGSWWPSLAAGVRPSGTAHPEAALHDHGGFTWATFISTRNNVPIPSYVKYGTHNISQPPFPVDQYWPQRFPSAIV